MFDGVVNTPHYSINKNRLHHAVFLQQFFENFRKSMNKPLFEAIKKLDGMKNAKRKKSVHL